MESYTIKNLSFSYPEQEKKVLEDISISIKHGEFVVLCGVSGCGKTTLLRQLKTVLTPHGSRNGSIYFQGKPLDSYNQREQSSHIGFVMQSPENQIVTDKVWHELAFGLESLGYDTPTIRLRVAEIASYFGIQNWFYKDVVELSGGQKQILNLAAIMAMQPSVLILDEPTSQLDPISAADFLATVGKLNRELGTTVILTEHRLEEALPMADRAIVLEDGKVIADGNPKDVGKQLGKENHRMFLAMPVPMRIYSAIDNNLQCPITVREGREWLNSLNKDMVVEDTVEKIIGKPDNSEPSVEVKEAWFKYERELADVVKGVSIKAYPGELLAILGGNGTGKSTTLSLISGVNRPYRGEVMVYGEELSKISDEEKFNGLLGTLPQNPQSLFVKKTVELDLLEMFKGRSIPKDVQKKRVKSISKLCDLSHLMEQHPYDLSGGEQQRAALAKILLLNPKVLLLDEPTKGMDAEFKQVFASILKKLLKQDVTIIMVSHDIEFCAKYADYCALFFDGDIVSKGSPREFFTGNNFYTTASNRMARHLLPSAVTAEDVIKLYGGDIKPEIEIDSFDDENYLKNDKTIKKDEKESTNKTPSNIKRRITAIISLIILIITAYYGFPILSSLTWAEITNTSEVSAITLEEQWSYTGILLLLIISLTTFCLSTFQRGKKPPYSGIQIPKDRRKLSKRTIVASLLILLLIPLTIFIGVFYLDDRKYYFISLLIILEIMLPFAMIYEGRKPQARELVIIAVLCAIGVAGRAAFFMLPQFKPVAAIVIIAGVAFGAESGFLVGAMTMLLSNIMYSQGPWTPWQMFSMGIIGFLSGLLFRKGLLRRDRISLGLFGGIAVFIIYGGIMNPASVLMFQSNINKSMVIASYVTGAPFDLIHASATAFFIIIFGETMLEKLDRIKIKYGLVEDI